MARPDHQRVCSSNKPLDSFAATEDAIDRAVAALPKNSSQQATSCFICLGDHEPLSRGCACRGSAGWCHVDCLATLAEQGDANDFERWWTCVICKQKFTGVLALELMRRLWRRHRRSPSAVTRRWACTNLGFVLSAHGEFKAAQSLLLSAGDDEHIGNRILNEVNRARALAATGNTAQAINVLRDAWHKALALPGNHTLDIATGDALVRALLALGQSHEAEPIAATNVASASRKLGLNNTLALQVRKNYANALRQQDRLIEAKAILEHVLTVETRIFGTEHPRVNETRHFISLTAHRGK